MFEHQPNPSVYPRLWRATANGLEGLAALHNDGVLILDELSQIDPREAGEAAYLLANGQGKTRSSQSGAPRQSARWRLLFLSAGEESLTALMARAGRKANAGQEIRLADIEADAGHGMGAFDVLNGQPSPAALALAIKDAAIQHHGAVGLEWLRLLVNDRAALITRLESKIREFVERVVPSDAAGQVLRVARRFALVAVAGELATDYGLTGWKMGEAEWAAKTCFDAWLDSFGGTGNKEERAILSQVQAFFEAHGASRFEDVETAGTQRIINRVGYVRKGANGGQDYLVLPEAFRRELCSGFDFKVATATLIKAGWLRPGNDGKTSQKPSLPGFTVHESGTIFEIDVCGDKVVYDNAESGQLHLNDVKAHADEHDLVRHLDRACRQVDVGQAALLKWLLALVRHLIGDRGLTLTALVRGKYLLAEAVRREIDRRRLLAVNSGFQKALPGFTAAPVLADSFRHAFTFRPNQYPARPPFYSGRFRFKKHYYSVINDLSEKRKDGKPAEEFVCARAIDVHPGVKHWVRNVERDERFSFWLPTATDYFYPDFVAELLDGRVMVVEYKGAHLLHDPDTREKDQIGRQWEASSGGKCLFLMAMADDNGRDVATQIADKIGRKAV